MKGVVYLSAFALLLFAACGSAYQTARQQRYMEKTYLGIKEAVNEAEVSILKDTVKVLFPEHLLFSTSSAVINPENYPLIKRFAEALNKYHKTNILISGHTDPTGGVEINQTLSQNRADSTRNLLLHYKVEHSRMFTWGLGSNQPITDNDTPASRRKNRRVEFIILYSHKAN